MLGDPTEITKKIPLLGWIITQVQTFSDDYGWFVTIICVGLFIYATTATNIPETQIFAITILLVPIWLTWFIFYQFFETWSTMVGKKFYLKNGRTTLRIKLPQEVLKSPEAMEFVLSQIHNVASPDDLLQTYLDGKRPLPYAFEIVSIGGDVRLYANVPTSKTKMAFEAAMYSQYPGVEVVEEPVDYAAELPVDNPLDENTVFAVHMGKKKAQEYPIKTYIDFELNKMPKEEEKVDPMTPMLELISGIEPHERVYIQIVATPHRPSSFSLGQLMLGESPTWEKGVEEEINKIMNRDPKTKAAKEGGTAEELARLTGGERDLVHAMERNAGKYAYETGIRFIYINKKKGFNGDLIGPLIRTFSQYDIIGRNALGVRWRTDINYHKFIPGSQKKINGWREAELKEYKLRKYFNKAGSDATKIFTAEELATMFHIPGRVAITPNLERIGSSRSEAPVNLPIGELPT